MCVPQEDTQHPTAVAYAGLSQTFRRALGHERAEQRRGQLLQSSDSDPPEIGLETAEVVRIVPHRLWPQPTLHNQILEEPRHRLSKRVVVMRTSGALESGNDESQHLLHWSACLLCDLPRCAAVLAFAPRPTNALGHIRVDMSWQISDLPRSPLTRELSKGDETRDSPPDRANIVALVGQPADVLLDLAADP